MEGDEGGNKKKTHRERNSGRKADKKKNKKKGEEIELTDKQKNPKAFTFNSAIRAERRFRRKQDIDTKKQHIPVVDRTPIEPPPILIAVVGPPKVGKTTLINNLIKLFTKSPLTDIKGPVTIVTGKKRRITIIECNNDINSMIDLAKVADLTLLLCDASFGFEMEIFEFLNICQVHGMPRIMGILTHLDVIKNSKTLKNVKKTLKHRFWTEVYPGAKLFYLSGILHGEYLRNEVKNLGRFISVMKFRPLTWRQNHSYLLGDRYEDLTNQELVRKNPKCNRSISLYGYIRGVPLKKDNSVHVAGLGDLKISDMSFLPDPCPLPEEIKKRALIEKEKFIYAPFSGVGGIVYDKDAVYVELGGSHSHKQRKNDDDEATNIVTNLIEVKETLDVKMQHSELQLFTGGTKFTAKDLDKEKFVESTEKVTGNASESENDLSDDEDNKNYLDDKSIKNKLGSENQNEDIDFENELKYLQNQSKKEEKVVDSNGRVRRKVIFETTDADLEKSFKSDDNESDDNNDNYELNYIESDEDNNKKFQTKTTKSNQEKDVSVHSKILNVLKNLETKTTSELGTYGLDNSLSDINDDAYLKKQRKKKWDSGVESNEIDTESSDSECDFSDDLLTQRRTKTQEGKKIIKEEESDSKDSKDIDVKYKESLDFSNNLLTQKKTKTQGEQNIKNKESESEDSEDMDVKWKENLAKKAQDAFLDRISDSQNLMKLVYGIFDLKHQREAQEKQQNTDEELLEEVGGFLKKVSKDQEKLKMAKDTMNLTESSLMFPWNTETKDWTDAENKCLIANCFVTGKWKDSEDAAELLKLDDAETLSEVGSDYGDFEDLEAGIKYSGGDGADKQGVKRKREEGEKNETADTEALEEKKRKLKEKFDAEYDNTDKSTYYDELKMTAEKQAQLNKTVFENMPDDIRVQVEGFRPGMYVRIEFENVPAEFISNFDPTYPLVIGSLNMGEENIGYVNVKLKKHRWYKKILKTRDPLIVSLGWRRFQTVPLYSKLEDDLKFRYLKYTPEHLSCNSHFWGPITPQGTGFLALQSVDSNPEILKKQGFRIAATGSVQELDKSTQIMKKLKLIGYPMKIYKKTAFVKGMFNSALEVARFEGARIKTVSGIRGQIKKAASKPEGVFRATFEDKIQLSDIVFCRTWFKVDVPEFYNPVTTLLLPPDQKNQWKGARTTGEIKRDKGIRNEANLDSMYLPITREEKPLRPLVVPSKLQKALPYRDKPKHGIKASEKKQNIKRVAVIREPQEQKISSMMKMIKTAYQHKQEKLKQETKERLEKHRRMVTAQEQDKDKKIKQKKKEVFRKKSKAQASRSKNEDREFE